MKVKDFIDKIRPITALNPESEVVLSNFQVPCDLDIDKVIISSEVTHVSLIPILKQKTD